jgi:hypothetical protein
MQMEHPDQLLNCGREFCSPGSDSAPDAVYGVKLRKGNTAVRDETNSHAVDPLP